VLHPDGLQTVYLPLQEFLRFSPGNAKLQDRGIAIFSLPAGYTCPGASECHSMFDRSIGKIVDGAAMRFRCYAASLEARYPALRNMVDNNQRLLREAGTEAKMRELIRISLPAAYFDKIRIHQDGDFFNMDYFKAWINTAKANPDRLFYAYTKSIHLWIRMRDELPPNFVLTASKGGLFDALADKHGLRSATVVFHPDEAEANGWKIDHDDSLAMNPEEPSFSLLLHGGQAAGSDASKALSLMRSQGINYSYSKTSQQGHTPGEKS